tara:strand:- start:68 stop:427 length:360 start_codon:yes stop_codon:yes gene_type:complete
MIEAKLLFSFLVITLVLSLLKLKYTNQLRLIEKLIFLIFVVCIFILIINPFILEKFSAPLKIERGRDLLMYLYILFSSWGLIRTHIRINLLSSRINTLAGDQALNSPKRESAVKNKNDV